MFIEFDDDLINTDHIIRVFKVISYETCDNKYIRDDNGKRIEDYFLIILRLNIDIGDNKNDFDDIDEPPECFLHEFFDDDEEEEFNERWQELVVLLKD